MNTHKKGFAVGGIRGFELAPTQVSPGGGETQAHRELVADIAEDVAFAAAYGARPAGGTWETETELMGPFKRMALAAPANGFDPFGVFAKARSRCCAAPVLFTPHAALPRWTASPSRSGVRTVPTRRLSPSRCRRGALPRHVW